MLAEAKSIELFGGQPWPWWAVALSVVGMAVYITSFVMFLAFSLKLFYTSLDEDTDNG